MSFARDEMKKNFILSKLSAATPDPCRYLLQNVSLQDTLTRLSQLDDYESLIGEIRREAASLLQETIPELHYHVFKLFQETGSRSEYERLYFRRRKRLTVFGILSLLEPDHVLYREALCEIIRSICDESTWCLPAHYRDEWSIDLFVAETAFALSEILALYGDGLPELLRERVILEIENRVFEPFEKKGPYDWETATHNWASVCAGSIGAAAIYLLTETDRLAAFLERVICAMDFYLQGFETDGACAEGYSYWQYGFGFFVYFADLLKQRTSGGINLFVLDKVGQIALFQQKCFLDDRKVVNFSDSVPESGVYLGLTHYLKTLYDEVHVPDASLRAVFNDDHCSRWVPAIRNLLWLRNEAGSPWPAMSYYMENTQWFVSRSVLGDGRYAFAAKGGHNAEPHNHNDIGQFILAVNGNPIMLDLGSGQYSRDYFGPARYDILCNGSQGHSVPIINGACQKPGRDAMATIREASISEEYDVFAIEMSSAYDTEQLLQLVRTFTWVKTELRLELADRYTFAESPRSITERFIVLQPPELASEGILVIRDGPSLLSIAFDPEQLDWVTESLLHVDHFGNRVNCFALDFSVKSPSLTDFIKLSFSLR
ncbi:heparinase II/III family protein [Cohnella silvisoli]|uniref:Heparinase II/III family protein n=1 Tax=Cohnella silvisoli TaxID=2873699 RepID=A0ABV1KQ94_9BACL|nr:heparinase II/III family protein [Cohnella silvisoli]MCD9021044.1 heparinase II/III-family protein [Cohnella silvisoli]